MSRSWKKHPVAKLKNDKFMKRLNSKLGRKFRIDEDGEVTGTRKVNKYDICDFRTSPTSFGEYSSGNRDEDYGVMKNRYEKQYRRK